MSGTCCHVESSWITQEAASVLSIEGSQLREPHVITDAQSYLTPFLVEEDKEEDLGLRVVVTHICVYIGHNCTHPHTYICTYMQM